MEDNKILVILGPTSTGKTDLALRLAKKFNGELISCDSRQVYWRLDIGTGKLPDRRWKVEDGSVKKWKGYWEIDGIKIWMYDVVSPKVQYTVADYVKDANKAVGEIINRGKLPIVVGGTGLYLKALLDGLSNLSVPVDAGLRKELEKLSKEQLQKKLKELSSQKWEKLNSSDRENPRRLVRAIELEIMQSKSNSIKIATSSPVASPRNDTLKIGLIAPREILYQRIDQRVTDRISQGMIDEAIKLHQSGLSLKRMRQLGLEYGVLADYLEGKITNKDTLIKIMQGKIHGFLRRQITWFKKETDVNWFDITRNNTLVQVEKLVDI